MRVCSCPSKTGEVHWALARNADGTAFELVEAKPGAARELEIGLVVPDLAKAREFFTGLYGAKELPEATSRVLPGEKELRFTTGATVFKCWSPKGERASDTKKIPEVLGFRYITHNVRDTQALHDALTARGIELASPLASHQGVASLFMVRGPGGAILEFVCMSVAGASGAGVARPAAAQQIAQQLQDMFNRIDRDGDGKLSPSEMPNAEKFKQMDANGDGFVTLEETAKSFAQGGAARRGSPDPAETPDRQVSSESGRHALGQAGACPNHWARAFAPPTCSSRRISSSDLPDMAASILWIRKTPAVFHRPVTSGFSEPSYGARSVNLTPSPVVGSDVCRCGEGVLALGN